VKLPNRAKALNHWAADGSGRNDSTGTIKDCPVVGNVQGLRAWARSENKQRRAKKASKAFTQKVQDEVDDAVTRDSTDPDLGLFNRSRHSTVTRDSPSRSSNTHRNAPDQLNFIKAWSNSLDQSIGALVVEEATPLALVGKLAFREAIDTAIELGANIGKGVYSHVGQKRLRNDVIPSVVDKQSSTPMLKDFDSKIARFGATMVSDGKDDVSKDHLINYLTVCPDGYRFECSRDVSGLRRKSEWVADDLLAHLGGLEADLKLKLEGALAAADQIDDEQLEANEQQQATDFVAALANGDSTNYVQIVTDTPSVNAKAWRIIEEKVPHLLANPCIFHCLNLYFTHLLKGDKSIRNSPVEPVAVCVEVEGWTKKLEQFFTNKEMPRSALRAACMVNFPGKGPRRLRKYSDTRAAIAYRVWHRVDRLKLCLRQAITSTDYVQWEDGLTDAEEKERAASIREIVADDDGFKLLHDLVAALTPVYKLLRLVDGYTPAVGKIYFKSQHIDGLFQKLRDDHPDDEWYLELHNYWVRDWGYMHVDLHSLGYCVDPGYHSLMDQMPADVWDEFIQCATRMLKAAPAERGFTIQQLTSEYARYQNLTGTFNSVTIELAKNQPAHLWWQQWGKSTPALQFVAMRALAQTVSASCSEQAWSEYDIIHCRRRNRLEKSYASKLTRGHNQARLIRRMSKVDYKQKYIEWTDSEDDDEAAFFSD
jgi:hypothetical protein